MRYLVEWTIDVSDATNPQAAAIEAWQAMRRPDSTACVFKVIPVKDEIPQHGDAQFVDLSLTNDE